MHDDSKDKLWAAGIIVVMLAALVVLMFIH
jgi:hypothetical protein